MNEDARRVIEAAKALGWVIDGTDGNGHWSMHHPVTGSKYSTAKTPSDWRALKNAVADIERLSRRRLTRQKTGRSSFKGGSGFSLYVSESSRAASDEVAALRAEADGVLDRFQELATDPRRNKNELGELAVRWQQLSDLLDDRWQPPLPPLASLIA